MIFIQEWPFLYAMINIRYLVRASTKTLYVLHTKGDL